MKYMDVSPHELIKGVAGELKEKVNPPEWAQFVKTSVHKERPPQDADWWYLRSASVLRTVALLGPIGTNKLKTKYGGRQRRGHRKPKFATGSGSIARKSLQQLEAAGLIKQAQIKNHKGRVITSDGIKLLNKIAGDVQNGNK